MLSKSTFHTSPQVATNLVGDIRMSFESSRTAEEAANFFIELEAVMTKYKVVQINVSFDVFKMQRKKEEKSKVNN